MADSRQLTFLQSTVEDPSGYVAWHEFKTNALWLDLSGADLSSLPLRQFDLAETNLSAAMLENADLTAANLSKANLTLSQVGGACLREANFEHATLTGANLSHCDLADARMEAVNGYNCNLSGANLIGADLAGSDLREADLRGTCLKYVRLSGALLDGANVDGADMTGCILDPDAPNHLLNFDRAKIDDRRYRQMRSRFNSLFGDLDSNEATDAGLSVARRKRRRSEPAGVAVGPTVNLDDTPAGSAMRGGVEENAVAGEMRFAAQEQVYDLTSVEGCCTILEVAADADMDAVAKAFRKKAKIYHPDKVRHLNPRLQELAAEEFRRLHQAYERLTRHTTRSLEGIIWAPGVPHRTSPYEYTSAEYEQLVRLNPANTSIIYNLAWKYFEEGKPFDAKVWFEKLLELNPGDAEAQYNLMVVRLYLEVQLPMLGG